MFIAPHAQDQYDALKGDIDRRRQILVPVVKDQHGNTIDGFAREAIAAELGIGDYPTLVMAVSSEDERRHLAYLLNANRRHLTATQKRELVEAELGRNPTIPARQLARLVGVSPQTVLNIRSRLQGVQNGHDDGEGDVDEKKIATVIAVNKRQVAGAQKALTALGEDAPRHGMTSNQAGLLARQARIDRLREQPVPTAAATELGIHHCDFLDLPVEDGAARLIVADLPYLKEYLPSYGDLAEWASRKLAEDGVLLAYAGVMYLDEVFRQMSGKGLNYLWTFALVHAGLAPKIWNRNVTSGWKVVIAFGRGDRLPECLPDVIRGGGAEKDEFEWQQRVDEVESFVRRLSKPGDLVVSPTLGSGTDALAVRNVGGRRFIGGDIDRGMVNLALERLKAAPPAAGVPVGRTAELPVTVLMPTLPPRTAKMSIAEFVQ